MKIETIAIVGAGTMGGGIAITCLMAGLRTTVVDLSEEKLQALSIRMDRHFSRLVDKEKMTADEARDARSCLSLTRALSDVARSDLIIEAVFEDLGLKRNIFSQLAGELPPRLIVATNTSTLRLADLADALPDPSRFLGLHYFSPAEHNPLVELISGDRTKPEVLSAAQEFLERTGKTQILCSDSTGFAINRFFCPYTNEAARLLDEGVATTGQIDDIAQRAFDLALGPFAVMNIVKPRISLNAVENLAALGPFYEPAQSLQKIGSTEGSWNIEDHVQPVHSSVEDIVVNRLQAALFFPILEALGEGVAQVEAFELGARLALRFGKLPIATMREMGRDAVEMVLEPLLQTYRASMPKAGLDRVFDFATRAEARVPALD